MAAWPSPRRCRALPLLGRAVTRQCCRTPRRGSRRWPACRRRDQLARPCGGDVAGLRGVGRALAGTPILLAAADLLEDTATVVVAGSPRSRVRRLWPAWRYARPTRQCALHAKQPNAVGPDHPAYGKVAIKRPSSSMTTRTATRSVPLSGARRCPPCEPRIPPPGKTVRAGEPCHRRVEHECDEAEAAGKITKADPFLSMAPVRLLPRSSQHAAQPHPKHPTSCRRHPGASGCGTGRVHSRAYSRAWLAAGAAALFLASVR